VLPVLFMRLSLSEPQVILGSQHALPANVIVAGECGRSGGRNQTPAARMTSPGIQADSSDTSNTASGAISLTRPVRPSGVFSARTAPAPPAEVPADTLLRLRRDSRTPEHPSL